MLRHHDVVPYLVERRPAIAKSIYDKARSRRLSPYPLPDDILAAGGHCESGALDVAGTLQGLGEFASALSVEYHGVKKDGRTAFHFQTVLLNPDGDKAEDIAVDGFYKQFIDPRLHDQFEDVFIGPRARLVELARNTFDPEIGDYSRLLDTSTITELYGAVE